MVFKKRSEDGEVDPNINRAGRPKTERKVSRREQKDKELMAMMRKLKPHLAASVEVISDVMRGDKTSDTNKLKAASLVIAEYRRLVQDTWGDNDEVQDSESEAEDDNLNEENVAPVFSLKIVND